MRSMVCAENAPYFHELSPGEDTLHTPFSQLAAVVFHLGCYDGAPLRIQLGTPIRGTARTRGARVKFVERTNGDQTVSLTRIALARKVRVHLGTDTDFDIFVLRDAEVEDAVAVTTGRKRLRLVWPVEGVRVVEVHSGGRRGFDDRLKAEILVDVCRLQGERSGGVDWSNLWNRAFFVRVVGIGRQRVLGRVSGVLVDGDRVEGTAITLVKVQVIAFTQDDNVPRIDGSRSAHEHAEDGICHIDRSCIIAGKLVDALSGNRNHGETRITCWITGSSVVVVLYLIRSTTWSGRSLLVVTRSYVLSYGNRRP
jgi:hypothetical protein